jgi:4-diphosphocytidyl-2-C-methyl-D-erythritol kinase
MLCFPNAKINIGLNIIEKRPDQFHNIETVFYPIPLSDILEIIKIDTPTENKTDLIITGLEIDGDNCNNLCIKAYNLLDRDFHLPPVKIFLHKIIPTGAGLGGGSSDGAFTLTLLNKLFALDLNHEQLLNYASMLGSDCSFFIDNQAAFGIEKGNKLKPIEFKLSGYFFVLIKPKVSVNTTDAYKGVIPHYPEQSVNNLVNLPVSQWKNLIFNDFENTILKKYPPIKQLKDKLYHHGALYASMTGSGAAVYGIFENEIKSSNFVGQEFYWSHYL